MATTGLQINIGANVTQGVAGLKQLNAELNRLQSQGKLSIAGLEGSIKNFQQGLKVATNPADITKFNLALKALGDKTKELKTAGIDAGNGMAAGFNKAITPLRTLANIIPGLGISGLIGFVSIAVTKLVSSLINGSKAFDDITAKMKLFNEVNKDANKQAASQITDLKILYGVATNVNLSMADRLAAVKALKAEFPETFANISTEIILNDKARGSYDSLAKSILATSRAKAAKDKLDIIEGQRLDILNQKQKIINATDREKAAITKDRITTIQTGVKNELEANTKVVTQTVGFQRAVIDIRKKGALDEQDILDKRLADQAAFLIKFAGGENKIAKVIGETGKKAIVKATEDLRRIADIRNVVNVPVSIGHTDLEKAVNDAIETINTRGLRKNVLDIPINVPEIPTGLLKEMQEQSLALADVISNSVTPAFTGMFDAILAGESPLQAFFRGLGQAIQQLIQQLIAAAIQAAVLSLISGGSSGITKLSFGQAFKFPGFAEGGVVFGPTLAMIGEGSGTSRSNPEIVAPLDRLKGLIGKSGGTQRIEFVGRTRGKDTIYSQKRTERSLGRTTL